MDEVLDRLPGGFLSFRDDGLILATNKTLREMIGYEEAELEGSTIERLLTLPSRIFYQTHLFPLLKIQSRVDEVYLTLRTKDGLGIPVLLNGRSVGLHGETSHECLVVPMQKRDEYEEEILRAKAVAERATEDRDVAHNALQAAHELLREQQNQLEGRHRQLELLSAQLEDRVRERTAELEQLLGELQSFNYSIAHNLRSPLRAILSSSALFMDDHPEPLSPGQLELLGRQKLNVEILNSMIEDLLRLSRLSLQVPVKQEAPLSELALQALTSATAGRSAHFTVSVEPDLVAWADPAMLSVLMQCLADNAVKYSPIGGALTFSSQAQGDEQLFLLKDEGIGMNPDFIHSIFKPFERLHREEFRGNGIGLAIVDRIVRHHGGRVWVESALGKGSTFYFSLS